LDRISDAEYVQGVTDIDGFVTQDRRSAEYDVLPAKRTFSWDGSDRVPVAYMGSAIGSSDLLASGRCRDTGWWYIFCE
jgi:hypothetical protein